MVQGESSIFRLRNLALLGTSHVSQQSVEEVRLFFQQHQPGVVCLELDHARLPGLLQDKRAGKSTSIRDIFSIGIKGYLFNKLGAYVEQKLGNLVGMKPGSEMRQALALAQQHDSKVYLIDQDIRLTLRKLSKSITWREKMSFAKDFFSALLFKKKRISFDLRKVPSPGFIESITEEVRKKYPSIYKALIVERNQIMAKALKKIMERHETEQVFAIVGAGHVSGIRDLLMEQD